MKNLVTKMIQNKPNQALNNDHSKIQIYIRNDYTTIIQYTNELNYTQWLSIGKLTHKKYEIGKCINELMNGSPLSTSTVVYATNYEKFTKLKYIDLFIFYHHLTILNKDGQFYLGDTLIPNDLTDEEMNRLIDYENQVYRKQSNIKDIPLSQIKKEIEYGIYEIKEFEYAFSYPWALEKVYNEVNERFAYFQNKYMYVEDPKIHDLLREFYLLKQSIYNKYIIIKDQY